LEEINALFGDEVVVHFSDATEKQRSDNAAKILAEDEGRDLRTEQISGESVSTTTAELKV